MKIRVAISTNFWCTDTRSVRARVRQNKFDFHSSVQSPESMFTRYPVSTIRIGETSFIPISVEDDTTSQLLGNWDQRTEGTLSVLSPFFSGPTSIMSAEKSLALPKASVKRIMKLSDEVQNVSAEAVIAVSKVTEDFLNQIVAQAHEVSQAHNRKTIKVKECRLDHNTLDVHFIF